jgi:hypothetical protein
VPKTETEKILAQLKKHNFPQQELNILTNLEHIKKEIAKWLPKFSLEPLWEALSDASKESFPKRYSYPQPPKLKVRGGYLVFEYSLPGRNSSISRHTGIKAKSIEAWWKNHEGKSLLEFEEGQIVFEKGKEVFAEFNRELEHLNVLWNFICAAIAAHFF